MDWQMASVHRRFVVLLTARMIELSHRSLALRCRRAVFLDLGPQVKSPWAAVLTLCWLLAQPDSRQVGPDPNRGCVRCSTEEYVMKEKGSETKNLYNMKAEQQFSKGR